VRLRHGPCRAARGDARRGCGFGGPGAHRGCGAFGFFSHAFLGKLGWKPRMLPNSERKVTPRGSCPGALPLRLAGGARRGRPRGGARAAAGDDGRVRSRAAAHGRGAGAGPASSSRALDPLSGSASICSPWSFSVKVPPRPRCEGEVDGACRRWSCWCGLTLPHARSSGRRAPAATQAPPAHRAATATATAMTGLSPCACSSADEVAERIGRRSQRWQR
jgi:hypothetical protein